MPEVEKEVRDDAEAPEWAKKLDAKLDAMLPKVDACMSRMDSMEVFKDSKADVAADSKKDSVEDPDKEEGKPAETAADKGKADNAAEEQEKEEKAACDAKADAAISSGTKLSKEDKAKLSKLNPEKLAAYKAARKQSDTQLALDAARADAASFKARVDELEKTVKTQNSSLITLTGHVHISDADRATMAEIQSRADAVHQQFGVSQHAPSYQPGETPLSYRRRLIDGLKQHSPKWSKIDLATADESLIALAEEAVFADAATFAGQSAEIPRGTLRAVVKEDARTGRKITEWRGDKSVWMDQFKAPAQLQVRIKKDFRHDD